MAAERGDNMLRLCQQHLLSQVDTAGNTQWNKKRQEQARKRERERRTHEKGRRSEVKDNESSIPSLS